MPLNVSQQFIFGGVDSRSNPLNYPSDRLLRCKNWIVARAGNLQLRWGYNLVTMSAFVAAVIHSLELYELLNQTRYVLFSQGTTTKRIDVATGTVSTPTVKGTPIASAARWSSAFANNCLHRFNGTDKKFLDGAGILRDSGLRPLTSAESAAVVVAIGAADATGLHASTIGGPNPGFQFYACLYNRQTKAVGNRMKIGARVVTTVASDVNLSVLPDLSGVDTEWDILLGRTQDGAEIPYVCLDAGGNWIYVPNGTTTAVITTDTIDSTSELPERNTQPQAFDKIAKLGTRLLGNLPNSPFIYWTEAEEDAAKVGDFRFVGDPVQCWPLDNLETMPTAEAVTCLRQASDSAAFAFSLQRVGILVDSSGEIGWQGPWEGGCPGQEAWTNTDHGPYWLSTDKQILTMSQDGPIVVSDEYERSLLAKIGDAYLGTSEVRYHRDPAREIDHLVVIARDANGATFQVIHDFNLRTAGSQGQGYESNYSGPLASPYQTAMVRDANGRRRLWAGATDGKLYQLFEGSSDAGSSYSADGIALLNGGPNRSTMKFIEWYGDSKVLWSVARKLNVVSTDKFTDLRGFQQPVPGGENDFQYRVALPEPEVKHIYVRFQLTSHIIDGNLELNEPLHIPLEWYGRIYLIAPLTTPGRGH